MLIFTQPKTYSQSDCPPSTHPDIHIVQRGETLSAISKLYGIHEITLLRWNGLSSSAEIYPCLQLVLKNLNKPTSIFPQKNIPSEKLVAKGGKIPVSYNYALPEFYMVRQNESLFQIAQKFNLSVEELKHRNGLISTNLKINQRLRIQKPIQPINPSIQKEECLEKSTYNTHIVQRGENLYGIAREYGITSQQLKQWNGLKKNLIHPCMRLLIQPPSDYQINSQIPAPSAGTTYYFQPQTAPATVTPATQPTSYAYVGAKGANYHTIAKDETLYQIAKTYNIKVDELKRINGLNSNKIISGEVLLIPRSVAIPQAYVYFNPNLTESKSLDDKFPLTEKGGRVTGKGDMRSSLPNDEKIILKKIDDFDNVKNMFRFSPVMYKQHLVKDGDTYFKLMNMYDISINYIKNINNKSKTDNSLKKGEILKIKGIIKNYLPPSSGIEILNDDYFHHPESPIDMHEHLIKAVKHSGYEDRFEVFLLEKGNGIAIKTKPEKINNEGFPLKGSNRWNTNLEEEESWWSWFSWRTNSKADIRFFIFYITTKENIPTSFATSRGDLAYTASFEPGQQISPDINGRRIFIDGKEYICTVLLYEFDGVEGEDTARIYPNQESKKSVIEHLEKSGIVKQLYSTVTTSRNFRD